MHVHVRACVRASVRAGARARVYVYAYGTNGRRSLRVRSAKETVSLLRDTLDRGKILDRKYIVKHRGLRRVLTPSAALSYAAIHYSGKKFTCDN